MTIGVLFVCTGNICRSPTAEGVFRSMARDAGFEAAFTIDSAGTYGGHAGEPPSRLAIEAAARRGYDISGLRARRWLAADIARFDHVLAMDRGHLASIAAAGAARARRAACRCSPPPTSPIPMAATRATTSARSTRSKPAAGICLGG